MPLGPSIVVLGAGFGGLRAAKLLSRKYSVTLIDRNAYHTYTPTLYEAATTSKTTANYLDIKSIVTFTISDLVRKDRVRFIQSEISSVDPLKGDICCANGQNLKFDYLVIALGSEVNYFNIPGLPQNSLSLKTFLDALRIRDAVINLLESGVKNPKIIVGGGGSTGIELAGEIKEWLCRLEQETGKKCGAAITIVEAASDVLPGLDQRVIGPVRKRLTRLGINAMTGETITEAAPAKLKLQSNKTLEYDLLIWTGGVKAANFTSALPLKTEKRGRIEVVGQLECLPQTPDLKLYGKIYALGDAICFYDPKTGKPMPGLARAAIDQATIVAHNIDCDIQGNKFHRQYQPSDYPYIIPVGGKWAAAKIGPLIFWGFWGWLLKGLVELRYLLSILPAWKALRIWLKGLWIFIKNDRLG